MADRGRSVKAKGRRSRAGRRSLPGAALVPLRSGRGEAARAALAGSSPRRLLTVARRILRDEESARDALQDALLAAWRSVESFDGRSPVSTWLYRIVVNTCLMRLREERRRPEVRSESLGDVAGEGSLDPFDMLDSIYCVIAVCDAIRELPTDYQAVIQLRCIEDLDTREAAMAAGVTPNTVKMRLYRARHRLRELLRSEYQWRFGP